MKFIKYLLPAVALAAAVATSSCTSSDDNSQELTYQLNAASNFVAFPEAGAPADANWKVVAGADITFKYDLSTPLMATLTTTSPITYAEGKTVRFNLEQAPFSAPDGKTGFRTIALETVQGFDSFGSVLVIDDFRFSALILTNGYQVQLVNYAISGSVEGSKFRVLKTQNLYYGSTVINIENGDVLGLPTRNPMYGITLDPKSMTSTMQVLNPDFSDSQKADGQVVFSPLPFTVNELAVNLNQPGRFDVKMVPAATGAAPVDIPTEKGENLTATLLSSGSATIAFSYINAVDTDYSTTASVSFTGSLLPILAQ